MQIYVLPTKHSHLSNNFKKLHTSYMIRIGQGIDFHSLTEGRELWLGGILIPSTKGCIAHSDGDVLIHAICDALLGAVGARDIGYHFPDTDNRYKNIDSKILLAESIAIIVRAGYRILNIDSTICIEQPKLSPHIDTMKQKIAEVIGVETSAISIKATTTEKMGFVGRGEGVEAIAIVLLESTTEQSLHP